MAKNKKDLPRNEKSNADYYKLNTDAVDRLVNADKIQIPNDKNLKDPAKAYRSNFLDRIPSTVKALFIKFWFSGAACFFIYWGLGLYIKDYLDMIFVMTVVMGMMTDILVNNALRFVETLPNENDKWMMFPKKKYWTFFANIVYAFLVLFCVSWFYNILNSVIITLTGIQDKIPIGVEPLLFGLFYMLFDILFVSMKNLFITIVNDAKNKVNKQ